MKLAVLFSGQGAQHPGMLKELIDSSRAARAIFDIAQDALGRDLYALCSAGTQAELDLTENTQPCLLACELAALRVLQEMGAPMEATLGFSLGEWAALVAAGSIGERDALTTVAARAKAMQQAVPAGQGGMAVMLGESEEDVQKLCERIGDIVPANYNCPGNITVAGTARAVERFLAAAQAEGRMASRVAISVPSHCWLMRPAADALAPLIEALPVRTPAVTLLMNATGRPVATAEEIRENMYRQLISPVRFQQSVEYLLDDGFDTFVEAGPGKTLCGMVKRIAKRRRQEVRILQFHDLETKAALQALI